MHCAVPQKKAEDEQEIQGEKKLITVIITMRIAVTIITTTATQKFASY